MISADKANIPLPFKRARHRSGGRNVLEAYRFGHPQVIETPKIAAVAKDGIQSSPLSCDRSHHIDGWWRCW